MKFKILYIFLTLLCFTAKSQVLYELNGNKVIKEDSIFWLYSNSGKFELDNEVLTIKVDDYTKLQKTLSRYGLSVLRTSKSGYIDVYNDNKRFDIIDVAKLLKEAHPNSHVEFNCFGEFYFTPNDEYLNDQWYIDKMNLKNTWDIVRGENQVTVAIIDSGVDWTHEDLGLGNDSYQNIWLNPGEDAWTNPNNPNTGNGVDNDGNGFIDDWKGWDFYSNDNDSRDTYFHGTAVAGIVSAKQNNQEGIAGIAGGNSGGVRLMPLKIGNTSPSGAVLDNAIDYAVDNGANIIQLSLSVNSSSAINTAIQRAINNNVIVICATGSNGSSSINYPSSNSNVIAVGATKSNDTRMSSSNYGTGLDVVAPGDDILSTWLNDTYDTDDGTSFAAPMVSGIAALILSIYPDNSVSGVRNIIESTTDKVGGVTYTLGAGENPQLTWNQQMGYGRVNACKAIREVIDREAYITGPQAPNAVCDDDYILENIPSTVSVTWNATPCYLFQNCSGTGTTANIKAASSSSSGPGTITFTVQTGCGNIQISKNIEVGPFNSAYITVTGTAPVCPGNQYVYTAYPPTGHRPSYSYSWTYPSGWFVEGQLDNWIRLRVPQYNPNYGTVRVSITNYCGSSNYTGITVYPGWGCGGYYSVFPNPSDSEIEIIANSPVEQGENDKVTVILLDETNRIALKKEISKNGGVIDVSSLHKGRYIMHVIDQNNKNIFRAHILIE